MEDVIIEHFAQLKSVPVLCWDSGFLFLLKYKYKNFAHVVDLVQNIALDDGAQQKTLPLTVKLFGS